MGANSVGSETGIVLTRRMLTNCCVASVNPEFGTCFTNLSQIQAWEMAIKFG